MKSSPPIKNRKSNPKKKIALITSFEKASEGSQCSLGWNIKDVVDLLEEYIKSPDFVSLLDVKQIICLGLVCRSFHRIFSKEYIQLAIRLGNLEAPLRYLFWIQQAPYVNIEKRFRLKLKLSSIFDSVYMKLLENEAAYPELDRIRMSIRKDVCRTYDDPKILKAEWQQKMENILSCLAQVYNEVGYCQGMSFLAGEIMYVVEEEELAFWLFAGIMEKHHLDLLFKNGLPAAHLHMHILSSLLEMHLPALDLHLRKLNSGWSMFTSKLIMTLCSSYIPLELLQYIYDVFFMDGWIGLYKIILSFLGYLQIALCEMDLAGISEFFREFKNKTTHKEIREILRNAVRIHLRKDAIEKGIDSFFRTEAEKLLKNQPDSIFAEWMKPYGHIIEKHVGLMNCLTAQYNKDVEHFHKKIGLVETQLVNANKKQSQIKAESLDMKIEYQGMRDQQIALSSTYESIKKKLSLALSKSLGKTKKLVEKKPTPFGATLTLPIENTINETIKKAYLDKAGVTVGDIYNGRNVSINVHQNLAHPETESVFGPSESTQDDLDSIVKKIAILKMKIEALVLGIKAKGRELTESELEISECRQHWDILQAQIKELGEQLTRELYKIYQEVGENLKKTSNLTIEMYTFN